MTDLLAARSDHASLAVPALSRARLVADLSRLHGLRIVKHPVMLIGVVWYLVGMGIGTPDTPYDTYSAVTGMVAFLVGPPVFFASNLVASSERRSGADEWMPALPLRGSDRVFGLLLAGLAPAALALVLSLGVLALSSSALVAMPVAWEHVASVPLVVLGAAVLGVAVARLLPWTGLPLLVMVALVTVNLWVSERYDYLGFYVDFAEWTDTAAVPAMRPGSPGWHLIYLVGLVGLAASGALLRDARRRRLPFASGAVFASVVLVAGWAQLP